MNPENNSLERTYFIGGPPRVGKTILAHTLSQTINGNVVSTDSIWMAAKKACVDKNSDLFAVDIAERDDEKEWIDRHGNRPEEVVEIQNRASVALWPSIVSFCNSFVEDSAIHIVEGVSLLPSLIADMKNRPSHIVFIGNTSSKHIREMLAFGQQNPEQDWMTSMGYSKERFEAMAKFVKKMSEYFKVEAEKYNFPYYELDDDNFDQSLNVIIGSLNS